MRIGILTGDRTDHVLAVLKALRIDALVTPGGDGTLRFSAHLRDRAAAGFLAHVDRTVISEAPADLDALIPLLTHDKRSRPSNYAVCVISEVDVTGLYDPASYRAKLWRIEGMPMFLY